MTSDLDIYRSANLLVKQHGEPYGVPFVLGDFCGPRELLNRATFQPMGMSAAFSESNVLDMFSSISRLTS